MSQRKKQIDIIEKAFNLLTDGTIASYSHVAIVRKLTILKKKVATATFSNLKKFLSKKSSKPIPFNLNTLEYLSKGLPEIIKLELGYIWDEDSLEFVKIKDGSWLPSEIKEDVLPGQFETHSKKTALYSLERRSVQDKIELITSARSEIIELGVRLKNFSSHFTDVGDDKFRSPLIESMNRGVNFKCYVLDPKSRFTIDYFKDRGKVEGDELKAIDELPEIIDRLKRIREELNAKSKKGQMYLYSYFSYPYLHASIADGSTELGRMYVSPYLFGIRRANCPVFEISRIRDKGLYKKFWKSVEHTIQLAKPIK